MFRLKGWTRGRREKAPPPPASRPSAKWQKKGERKEGLLSGGERGEVVCLRSPTGEEEAAGNARRRRMERLLLRAVSCVW